ncbi:homing endonuclease associated repeat-containing protein [Patulibacter medicamentivorans]|uniref:homing endonuclease associated repeat-containing protein n=1 Tax=Patulibacter medicamentivorans TaxID=1097667 RepID=UPI00058DC951|nr:hypothetical protein [Patulibacter medicamentivorans]
MAVDRARALEVIRLVRAVGNQHVSRRGYERWRAAQAEPESWPTATEIVGAFDGRWGHALRAAGLEVVRGPRKTVTDDEVLALIGRCAAEVGQVPTQAVYGGWAVGQDPPGPSGSTVSLRFGSWTAALRLAGLDPALARRRAGAVTGSTPERRAEVVAALRAFAVDVGVADGDAARSWETFRALGPAAYAAWREECDRSVPSSVVVRACASPWIAALQLAGLASAARVPRKPLVFTDDAMLRALRDAAAALPEGVGLSNLRYQAWRGDRDDVPTSRLVWERFGSWAAALTAAGVRAAPPAVDGEELLAALRRFLAETSGEPHRDRYLLWAADERRAPPVGAFTIAFGSWSAAIAAAGGPAGVVGRALVRRSRSRSPSTGLLPTAGDRPGRGGREPARLVRGRDPGRSPRARMGSDEDHQRDRALHPVPDVSASGP